MTPAEFVTQSLGFVPGYIYVVSGPDFNAVNDLLLQAQVAIEGSTPNLCLVYDSRATITTQVFYQKNIVDALTWEYISVVSDNFVVLVANQFDNLDPRQNPHPIDLTADVVRDIMFAGQVNKYPLAGTAGFSGYYDAQNRKYGIARDLFPFIRQLYFYDTRGSTVTFIRDSIPERP